MDDIDQIFDTVLGNVYDPYAVDVTEEDKLWRPNYAPPLAITEMTDSHLVNSINLWNRIYREEVSEELESVISSKLVSKFVDVIAHTRAMMLNGKYKFLWKEALQRGLING